MCTIQHTPHTSLNDSTLHLKCWNSSSCNETTIGKGVNCKFNLNQNICFLMIPLLNSNSFFISDSLIQIYWLVHSCCQQLVECATYESPNTHLVLETHIQYHIFRHAVLQAEDIICLIIVTVKTADLDRNTKLLKK